MDHPLIKDSVWAAFDDFKTARMNRSIGDIGLSEGEDFTEFWWGHAERQMQDLNVPRSFETQMQPKEAGPGLAQAQLVINNLLDGPSPDLGDDQRSHLEAAMGSFLSLGTQTPHFRGFPGPIQMRILAQISDSMETSLRSIIDCVCKIQVSGYGIPANHPDTLNPLQPSRKLWRSAINACAQTVINKLSIGDSADDTTEPTYPNLIQMVPRQKMGIITALSDPTADTARLMYNTEKLLDSWCATLIDLSTEGLSLKDQVITVDQDQPSAAALASQGVEVMDFDPSILIRDEKDSLYQSACTSGRSLESELGGREES